MLDQLRLGKCHGLFLGGLRLPLLLRRQFLVPHRFATYRADRRRAPQVLRADSDDIFILRAHRLELAILLTIAHIDHAPFFPIGTVFFEIQRAAGEWPESLGDLM